ncbi:isochorismatase [Cytophagales bacterium WSM2-2]|nr:isochorismatase [Cytophagales bacterium WSM2-2]
MKALLIIDMQNGCLLPYTRRHDTPGVIGRINSLSEKFRLKKYPVIFIQHDGTAENELFPQTNDWALVADLVNHPSDILISKTAQDSFYQTSLQQTLSGFGITEIYITGSAADFCVDTTIKSALSKDYKITVISDCHTTEDKANLPAKTLIAYYNWIWSALAPTKYKVSVIKAAEFEE